jgi:hypothetical protein
MPWLSFQAKSHGCIFNVPQVDGFFRVFFGKNGFVPKEIRLKNQPK